MKNLLTETQLVSGRARIQTQVSQKLNALNFHLRLPLFILHCEGGVQKTPPPEDAGLHSDYSEVTALENQQVLIQKSTLSFLLFLKSRR